VSDNEIHPMRVWRKKNNITLDDLSFLTGFSMASLSRIERYKQYPLIAGAKKIIASSKGYLKPEDFFGKVK
jgi:transcriptional regulator with XRE-family HTH domain